MSIVQPWDNHSHNESDWRKENTFSVGWGCEGWDLASSYVTDLVQLLGQQVHFSVDVY